MPSTPETAFETKAFGGDSWHRSVFFHEPCRRTRGSNPNPNRQSLPSKGSARDKSTFLTRRSRLSHSSRILPARNFRNLASEASAIPGCYMNLVGQAGSRPFEKKPNSRRRGLEARMFLFHGSLLNRVRPYPLVLLALEAGRREESLFASW